MTWRVITTAQAAELLQTSRDYVREHAAELGGYRLPPGGPRAALRFDPDHIRAIVEARRLGQPLPEPAPRRRPGPRRGSHTRTDLLPLPEGAK